MAQATDSYATVAQYRDAVGAKSAAQDEAVRARLEAASRLVDERTGSLAGRFGQADGDVKYFDGPGEPVLHLPEYRTSTTVAVDTTGDGTFDTTVDAGDRIDGPYNAADEAKPYAAILLKPQNTTLRTFPSGPYRIKVTADWGWAEVPAVIRDVTIGMAHDLWDLLASGGTFTLQSIDVGMRLTPASSNLLRQAENLYGVSLARGIV